MDNLTKEKITKMLPLLNEKQKRLYLATEAEVLGWSGTKAVSRLTGVSQTTIIKGKKEINSGEIILDNTRIRKEGTLPQINLAEKGSVPQNQNLAEIRSLGPDRPPDRRAVSCAPSMGGN